MGFWTKKDIINIFKAREFKFHTNRDGKVIYLIDDFPNRNRPSIWYLYELDRPKLNMVSAWGRYTPEEALKRLSERKIWFSSEKFKAVDQVYDIIGMTWYCFSPHHGIYYLEGYPNPRESAEQGYPSKQANRYVKGPAKSILELDDKGYVETVITKEGRHKSPVHVVPSGSYVLGSNKKYTPEQVKRKWYNKTMDFI